MESKNLHILSINNGISKNIKFINPNLGEFFRGLFCGGAVGGGVWGERVNLPPV